jgi:NAD(P)-dependent dehydrogenase (short-subunit alcohol dehydrogenase family)
VREPALRGQTVVLVGGSAGIGLETARLARAEGADVVLTARDAERLRHAAADVGAKSTSAFDAGDPAAVERFFREFPGPIDHVLITGPGPHYRSLAEITFEQARDAVSEHLLIAFWVARHAAPRIRPGGTVLLMGGTGARRPRRGLALVSAVTAAMPALTAGLAIELAPVRVNLIAAGFVDTPLSASLLGDQLDARRQELREALPIRRVVGPTDVAALAVHLMANTAVTGATFDVDGGQQLVGT